MTSDDSGGESIRIDARFRGPPDSGNGGYSCGLLGVAMAPHSVTPIEVTLRSPPPIDTPLRLQIGPPARLLDGDTLVGEARAVGPLEGSLPAPPSLDVATKASTHYLGFREHPFPMCFVCGPQRPPGDGLRIFAGRAEADDPIVAAVWTPDRSLDAGDGTVDPRFVWAALDCPGYFGFARDPVPALLGRMTVAFAEDAVVAVETPCVVIGWERGAHGRKAFAGSAIFDASGRWLAQSRQTWIEMRGR